MERDYTPETQLLYYYCEGIPRHTSVSHLDMGKIIDGLNDRRLLIYFPVFWNHDEVREFKNKFSTLINPENLFFVGSKLFKLLSIRDKRCVHWIERINLFHMYGLIRIYGYMFKTNALSFLNSVYTEQSKSIKNDFSIVSAINAKSVLENRDAKDETEFFELVQKNLYLVRDYGNYQMFYYGGIIKCIHELQANLNEQKKVPVPSSVLSLLVSCDLHYGIDTDLKTKVYDELYSLMPEKTKFKIDQIYKLVRDKLIE